MNIWIGLLTAIHIIVAVFLIVLVLMQKSHDQGVGAAFGGGMTDTMFGGGTTTALVRMTIWCACILLMTTLILAVLHSHRGSRTGGSLMQRSLATTPAMPESQPVSPFASQPSAPPTTSEMPPKPSAAAAAPAQQQPPATQSPAQPGKQP